MKVGLISLGCAKNRVTSEQMLYKIGEAGHEIVADEHEAEVVVINTCGFIESAKQEAIDTILEMSALKESGTLKKIVVTGCLSQLYSAEIKEQLPEVDAVLGVGNYESVADVIDEVMQGGRPFVIAPNDGKIYESPRILSTGGVWAYLLISEGCDNACAYCLIPQIKGPFRSRTKEEVIKEAEALVESGCKELILVAQDLTMYGRDLYGKPCLTELLRELAKIDGLQWIRLHYLYPSLLNDELIAFIANEPKIVKYLDIPVQHINNTILKKMRRRDTGESIRELFVKLRERIPGLVLRTSLICGLPYEGEAEYEELCNFVREAGIERAGVFAFSPEEGTAAYDMPYVDKEIAEQRAEDLRYLQASIMDEWERGFEGKAVEVLCEGYDKNLEMNVGRAYFDSPDIDGSVQFSGDCKAGDIVRVTVEHADGGVLTGRITEVRE